VIIGLYFWNNLKKQSGTKKTVKLKSRAELDKLNKLRKISLNKPLSEQTRPMDLKDIVGQQEGVRALRAALCGPNPQHVLIYGEPGVGKTAAARLILEEAKKKSDSAFAEKASFVELDAASTRFDERSIADPLIGSVHDPIYQGAGAMGVAGIPQPKPGAVTEAHGGILFIDEIGELHPAQMNKLLKVLEDRKVFFESAYYSKENKQIPDYVHDIFQRGMPADFRLVGATTRRPDEIIPAIRSRCLEIFFRQLSPGEIRLIASRAINKLGFQTSKQVLETIEKYGQSGRDAVNIVQLGAGIARTNGRMRITTADLEEVISSGRYTPRPENKIVAEPAVGLMQGLAVRGADTGMLLEIEAVVHAVQGKGRLEITGIINEEEIGNQSRKLKRKSQARESVTNVITVLEKLTGLDFSEYFIHLNFPGGLPVDGPSAGIAIALAIYSAVIEQPIDNKLAATGELSIRGKVKPVGGVTAKIAAAREAGVKRVLIPAANWQEHYDQMTLDIISVNSFEEILEYVFPATDIFKKVLNKGKRAVN